MKNYHKKFNMIKMALNKENPTILEIGAHYGEDSLRFLETFKEPKIYCFEPDPRNIEIFEKYVKSKKVNLCKKALSNCNGKSIFYQSFTPLEEESVPEKYNWISKEDYFKKKANNSGSSSLKKGYKSTFKNTIEVETIRADSWIENKNIELIDLIWIDVQGAEKEVIQGFGEILNIVNFIWIEYGEVSYEGGMTREETIKLLSDSGFVCIQNLSDKGPQGDLFFVNDNVIVDGRIVC
jgi:FkbM family methyltransferase